jgi:hypothetical protein
MLKLTKCMACYVQIVEVFTEEHGSVSVEGGAQMNLGVTQEPKFCM